VVWEPPNRSVTGSWNSFQGYDDGFRGKGTRNTIKFGAAVKRMQTENKRAGDPTGIFRIQRSANILRQTSPVCSYGYSAPLSPPAPSPDLDRFLVQDDWR